MMQKFYSYFNERGAKSSDLTPLVRRLTISRRISTWTGSRSVFVLVLGLNFDTLFSMTGV